MCDRFALPIHLEKHIADHIRVLQKLNQNQRLIFSNFESSFPSLFMRFPNQKFFQGRHNLADLEN